MVDLAFDLVQNPRPYARITNNKTLESDVDFAESELDDGKQIDIINRCKIIHSNGVKYLSIMEGYDINQDKLDDLEPAINGVAMLFGQREAIISAGKTSTEAIPVIIDWLRKHLDILDDLVPAHVDDEKFVQTYKTTGGLSIGRSL